MEEQQENVFDSAPEDARVTPGGAFVGGLLGGGIMGVSRPHPKPEIESEIIESAAEDTVVDETEEIEINTSITQRAPVTPVNIGELTREAAPDESDDNDDEEENDDAAAAPFADIPETEDEDIEDINKTADNDDDKDSEGGDDEIQTFAGEEPKVHDANVSAKADAMAAAIVGQAMKNAVKEVKSKEPAPAKSADTEEIKKLSEALKLEQKARAEAERALEKIQKTSATEIEKAQKGVQAEIDKAQKAAKIEADKAMKNAGVEIDKAKKKADEEVSRLKVEFAGDRAKQLKLHTETKAKADKEIARLTTKLERAEKTAEEKANAAAEKSRQVASLRMELSRERMKATQLGFSNGGGAAGGLQYTRGTKQEPQVLPSQPNGNNGNGNGNLNGGDQHFGGQQFGAQQNNNQQQYVNGNGNGNGQPFANQQYANGNGQPFGGQNFNNQNFNGQQFPNQQQFANQFGAQPFGGIQQFGGQVMNGGGNVDPTMMQIQQMLAELVYRMRSMPAIQSPGAAQPAPIQPPPLPSIPSIPGMPAAQSPLDTTAFSGMFKSQQDSLAAQMNALQQQNAQFAEITLQQQIAVEEISRKHRETMADLARKQQEVLEEIEYLKQEAEEEITKKQQECEEVLRVNKPTNETSAEQQAKQTNEQPSEQSEPHEPNEQIEPNEREFRSATAAATAYNPSVEEVADSLNDAIETRGGVAPAASPSVSTDFVSDEKEVTAERAIPAEPSATAKVSDGGSYMKGILAQSQPAAPAQPHNETDAETLNLEPSDETAPDDETFAADENFDTEPAEQDTEKDQLDELIANLSNELNDLKSQLGNGKKKK